MLLTCLFCVFAQAQTKVEVTLTDGKVVKGTTRTLFSVDDANSIKVKDAKGEKKTYKSTEVINLRVYDDKSQKWYTFEALKAQKALPNVWNKNPKPYSDPVFLQVVYEGKNVTGYVHNISTQTNTKTLQLTGTGGQGRRITLRHQFSKERTVPSRSLSFCLHAALSFILFYPC